jgi:hypothetical protein
MEWHAAACAVPAGDHVFLGGGARMEMTAKYNIEVASDEEDLAQRTVQLFVAAAHEAVDSRGVFCTAISGGHTPARFFRLLANTPEARSLPWDQIHIFWVDERYVPADSEASNYRLAADAFLDKVSLPPANVHRIPTEHEDISAAARAYERTIREVFGLAQAKSLNSISLSSVWGATGTPGRSFRTHMRPSTRTIWRAWCTSWTIRR